jgi:hypothetical protein
MSNLEKLSEDVDLAMSLVLAEEERLHKLLQLNEKIDPSSYHAALDLHEWARQEYEKERSKKH